MCYSSYFCRTIKLPARLNSVFLGWTIIHLQLPGCKGLIQHIATLKLGLDEVDKGMIQWGAVSRVARLIIDKDITVLELGDSLAFAWHFSQWVTFEDKQLIHKFIQLVRLSGMSPGEGGYNLVPWTQPSQPDSAQSGLLPLTLADHEHPSRSKNLCQSIDS